MRKLVYILAVNLQLLPACRVLGSIIRIAGLRCLNSARAKRVEEAILAFRGARCVGGCWSSVFLFEIVPLFWLAWTSFPAMSDIPVYWCFALRGRLCGGTTSMRRRKCLRYRMATTVRRGVGRKMCTRPMLSARLPYIWCGMSYIDYRICRTGEQ